MATKKTKTLKDVTTVSTVNVSQYIPLTDDSGNVTKVTLANTQRVLLINANDDNDNVFIYTNGNPERWVGGCVGEVIKLPITFMSPQPSNLVLGRGIVVGAKRDNDWG